MRLAFLILLSLSTTANWAQSNVLTGFKNGSWALLDTNGKVLTTTEYHYIHSFDQKNTSYFMKNGLYGILSGEGKELVSAEYLDVVQHGFGIYSLRNGDRWKLMRVTNGQETLFDTLRALPEVIGNNWIILNDSLQNCLINLQSGKKIQKEKNTLITLNSSEYMGLSQDSLIRVFDPSGIEIKSVIGYIYAYESRFIVLEDALGKHTIIDENGIWRFPYDVTNFQIAWKTIFCGSDNFGALYDIASKEILFQGPYTSIYNYNDTYYGVNGSNGANLIHRTTKKALLPNGLSYFVEGEKIFYVYRSNGTMALLDQNGIFIIPGYYDKISQNNQFLNLSLNGNVGLYSLKKKSYVFPLIYYSISDLKNNRYKALTDDAFTIVQLNEKHEVVNRIDGSNSIRIRTATSSAVKRIFDPRLFPLGWFVDSTEVEVKGVMKTRYLWGLKDENDSIVLKPKYPDLKYIHGPFSLQVNPEHKVIAPDGIERSMKTFEFVSWETGRKVQNLECAYIDSNDFLTQTWTKFNASMHIGIINEEGKIRYFTYLSGKSIPFSRYCESEKWERSPKQTDTSFYQTSWDFDPYESVANSNRFVAVKGKWNFIQPDGSDLFKEPFQFVEEFVGTTAIAKKNGKWGVITKDTVLIPFKFMHITRQIVGMDTLFITDESAESSRFLDEQLMEIKEIKSATAKSENLLLIGPNGNQQLINSNREILAENIRSMKKLPSGYFKAKVDKEIQLIDSAGTSVCTTENDVVNVIQNKYCVIEKNNRFGLTNFSNEIVLPENNGFIESIGKYISTHSDKYYLYNENLELINSSDNPIFIDPISNNYLLTKKTTASVYKDKTKIGKQKNTSPDHFWNNLIWTTAKDRTAGIALNGDTVVKCKKLENWAILPNGWLALKPEKGSWVFYESDWQEIKIPISSRKYIFIDTDYIGLLTKKGNWLIWQKSTGKSCEQDAIIGGFENDYCLVRTGNSFYYINRALEPVNNLRYSSASSFHNGLAAACDSRGGTLIDTNFKPLSYPSYKGLTYLGATIYQAAPQLLHNICRMNGSAILPESAENLSFVNDRILQIIDHGEIHYYRISGVPLF